ncbi:DUF885 domain-containing protein [Massilia arenae]|uniref:DUF885 domain-containing protein n=1 Tax=Massilia arenae TaxID=2603288 RepID=A0A5C7G3N0_9BURK|nr:DUF885 domain-containing protein [Massilia arenae]TXF99690.1 DUF885 domain-containing protein [Massilia arenae]
MRILFASLVLLAPLHGGAAAVIPPAPPAVTQDASAEQSPVQPSVLAARLYERDWQWQLRHAPERATALGEHRYNAFLSDTSLAGRAAALEHERATLAAAQKVDRALLTGEDQVSYDLFVADKERLIAAGALRPFDPLPITAYDGLQVRLPRLVAQMPFANDADYLTYLARLQALPAHVDGLIEQLRAGKQAGWTIPKAAIAPVPDALRALREKIADGALGAPFQRIPATIVPEVREQLRAAGKAALEQQAAPALRKLEDFLRQDYVPTARDSIGAAALPGGAAWYARLVRDSTTTAMTPAQVHALGQQEVARLRAEIERLIPRTGFRGGFAEFIVFARSDRRLFFVDAAALLDRYRRTLALAQGRLGRVATVIPAAGIVVKPMGGDGGGSSGQPAAYYEAGSAARTAALVVDTARLNARPIWQVDTVALHEGVPGHHLQVARAQELALPAFRRHGWYDAYGEGWATYAESLGPELGLFQDPFSLFGHLNEEMFRAARLVVDTGIHSLGWTRQQAIDYLNTHTANPPADNAAEVDRYIARPAQALGYKIGQLRILALRTQARATLGKLFDLRRFHDALLGGGALPLAELERRMGRWIAAEKDPATRAGAMPVAVSADAEFNAASEPVSTWEPAFEFDFVLDGELPPGYDPGPSPDFEPPAAPAPAPARKSFSAPHWLAPLLE